MALLQTSLARLSDLKLELGITGAADDDYLERLLNSCSAQIESYVGRTLTYEAGIVEDVRGYGWTDLIVSRTPIITVTTVKYGDSTIDADTYAVGDANAGTIYRNDGWLNTASYMHSLASPFRLPGTEERLYEITYTAGYITAEQEAQSVGTRTLPYDLEDACLQMATTRYAAKGRDRTLTSEKIGSAAESYGASSATATASGIPDAIVGILNRYKRAVFA